MSDANVIITDNNIILYDKKESACKSKLILDEHELIMEDFTIFIADNGGIHVIMPTKYGTTWPYAHIVSWKEVREKMKEVFLKEYDVTEALKQKEAKKSNQTKQPKTANNKQAPKTPRKTITSISNIRLKFHSLQLNGTCSADCIFFAENTTISNLIIKFDDLNSVSVDLPDDINEWTMESISWEKFAEYVAIKFKTYLRKMNIDDTVLQRVKADSNYTDEFWATWKGNMETSADSHDKSVIPNARELIGSHDSTSGVSPFYFVPNTVLRLEKYIENHEQNKEDKKGKKNNYSNNTISVDSLVQALAKDDFIGSFELDVLTWINRLRYVTTAMIEDLYVSGYIAPTWRKVTKDKFAKIINRMQKYNLVNVTRFAAYNDAGTNFETKAVSRIYTLGKNGKTLLRQLGRDAVYNAFDIYQDGNIVKSYMAANQHLVRWLSAFPSYIKNNFKTTEIVYSTDSKKIGARIYGIVNCGKGTVIIEPVRRSDRWTFEESSKFLKDKLSRIISLTSQSSELYHKSSAYWSSAVRFEINESPVICYTCEDEEHMKEVWELIKPVALENPDQKIWFTYDLNIYNDSAEGERFVEFSEDDTYKIVDIHELFGLGRERDYDFLYHD